MFNKSILGIDFFDDTLHIVELSYDNIKKYFIKNLRILNICDLLQKKEVRSFTQSLRQYGFSTTSAIIGIPEHEAIIIEINQHKKYCLEEFILEDIYEYLPESLADLNYDFIVLDKTIPIDNHFIKKINVVNADPLSENQQKILFVAVKKKFLDKRLKILADCAIEVKVVDLELFALMRSKNLSPKILTEYLTAFGLAAGALC